MKEYYSIGEVSKIIDVTIKALRYYHKVGILIPKYIDEETGYRYYSIDQFVHIDIIKGCRTLGTSILELQDIFKDPNTEKLLKFLEIKKKEAEEKIKLMNEIISNINILSESIKISKEIVDNDEIVIKHFNKRCIVFAPFKSSKELEELIYYSKLDKIIKENNMEITLERGIIYDISSRGEIKSQFAFVGLKDEVEEEQNIRVLPEGDYLTLVYNKENQLKCRENLMKYIEKNNINTNELIEVELYHDLFNTDNYSCQIQIYIDKNHIHPNYF